MQLSGNVDQNITLVDFGNVWTNLDSTRPVAFTAELNPNTDCPNQMEITEERWTNSMDSTDTFSSNDSGDWRPTNLENYRYSITLTAKDGYRFLSKENGAFDGTVICDGTVLSGVVLVTSGPTVSNDGKTLTVSGPYSSIAVGSQDDYTINNVVINNAPTSCTVGEAPKVMATKGDDGAYTFYEYWEEWAEDKPLVGEDPVKFWYSDAEQMNRVPADKRITTFEEGKAYSYSIIAEANENYTFASKDNLSVTMNGKDYTDKSEVISDGTGLMIGPKFMTPTTPATQKEIPVVEINNATLTFKDGDKPVFTGTVADGALYAIDYEGWFGEDGEFISNSEYWNNQYAERGWCDGLISSFKANTEYTYRLYLKLTDEAAAQGYVFGPNTKLKVNGKDVTYQHSGETGTSLQIVTGLTMTPAAAETPSVSDYTFLEGANGIWTQNSDGTLTFRANGEFSKFTGVKIDNSLIDAKNYTAKSGSTIITLSADYLKTLSVDKHKLTVVFTDGECSTNFEVKKAASEQTKPTEGDKSDTTKPAEGDKSDTTKPAEENKTITHSSNMLLWVMVLFVSSAVIFGTVVYTKRRKQRTS